MAATCDYILQFAIKDAMYHKNRYILLNSSLLSIYQDTGFCKGYPEKQKNSSQFAYILVREPLHTLY